MDELIDCRFCGGLPQAVENSEKRTYTISCKVCGGNVTSTSMILVIKLWNGSDAKEADEEAEQDEIERLIEANSKLRQTVNQLVRSSDSLGKELFELKKSTE